MICSMNVLGLPDIDNSSAKLNPGQEAFCIDSHSTTASLPIFINQTTPISIELLRIDLDTNLNETIAISAKEAKKLIKQADKQSGKQDTTRILRYPVKQTGLYRLQKVVDESNLEVQRVLSDTLVVRCPSASVKELARDKCRGELSNFLFQVDATPPIRIKYSKIVNRGDESSISLTVHPENLDSPLGQQRTSGALIKPGASGADVSWARTQHIEIPVNETLGLVGAWQYTIDEVQDGCGNVVSYNPNGDSNTRKSHKGALLHHTVKVHERPEAALYECSTQRPLKVAKGKSRYLPIWPNPSRQRDTGSAKLHIAYAFTPTMDDENGEGDTLVKTEKFTLDEAGRGPEISEPGTYVLTSVSTDFCSGEILEPTSCLLLNPPEPDLSITSENIPHKCAGNSVGLRVNLDLIGSPPFAVTYEIHRAGGRITPMTEHISHTRTQLEFTPRDAGHYTYEFVTVADDVYNTPRSLKHKQLKLEQDVKPTAFARFVDPSSQEACIQEPAEFDIALTGDAPWTLEYDLVHDGKRKKHKAQDINTQFHRLVTPNLQKGGQYSLTLTGITDASGCKIFLEQEVKIQVRHQRPSAAFGHIEGKRVAHMLEGRRLDLPLRLSGEPPWTLSYRKKGDTDRSPRTKQFSTANTVLSADSEDVYELLSVNDGVCPGTVEQSANLFEVLWVPRPTIRVTEDQTIKIDGGKYVKSPICEGDQDSMEISMTGNPPYFIKYHVHVKPELGRPRVAPKEETFGLHGTSIKMDTGTPGFYQYKFAEIGDQLYEPTAKNSPILIAQQTIHSRPSAKFVNSGKTYSYCKEQVSGDEVIPISLLGSPPFSLEMGIRHHATAKPEVMNIPHVTGNRYDFRIPQRLLSIGTHIVTIRKVVDSNGCQRSTDFDGPTIRVNVVDVPSIVPLEPTTDFCVGDPISFTLTGTPPFNVFYTFEGAERKAASSTNFRRIAERPGDFTITALSDKASTDACRALTDITKVIHPLPSVRISRGRTAEVDIHEGGDAEIMFEFGGTPPFKFT